jgi:neutral ceramidase
VLRGPIDFRHAFLDMRSISVAATNFTRSGTTCKPAMGFAFAAGTTDGERGGG